MKSIHVYIALLLLFAGFTTVIVHYRKPEMKLGLKMRQGEIASQSEWLNAKETIEGLINEVNRQPANKKVKLQLALAYINESRISGEHGYYDKAALLLLDEVLETEPENVDAHLSKATVLLSQHHFADAVPVAQNAMSLNPWNPAAYGVLTDAFVELGRYTEAIQMTDKMVSIRPDLRSYSRVSYLREIHGNYSGAIEAMKLAVDAGYPGLEQTAWARTYLGRLYEHTGDLENASLQYEITLEQRPSYAFALAGLGRVAKANSDYELAVYYFNQAGKQAKDFSFDEELTEVYRISNQPIKASEHAHAVVNSLTGVSGNESGLHGHYADRELAHAYLDIYDYEAALRHALIEYNRRPANIDVNQTLAWVYYKRGGYADANKYIDAALQTGSQNPDLLYRAGLIKSKTGEHETASGLMQRALQINPYLSQLLKWESPEKTAMK